MVGVEERSSGGGALDACGGRTRDGEGVPSTCSAAGASRKVLLTHTRTRAVLAGDCMIRHGK